MPIDRSRFALISREADAVGTPAVSGALRRELLGGLREFAERVGSGQHGTDAAKMTARKIQTGLDQVQSIFAYRFAARGFDLAGAFLGRPGFERIQPKVSKVIALGMNQEKPLVSNFLGVKISDWLQKTSRVETDTSANDYESLWKMLMQEGITHERELSRAIMDFGLARVETRARVMAQTISIYAYNAGANDNYRGAGVEEKEWQVTEDDALCPYCSPMDGKRQPIDGLFQKAGHEWSVDSWPASTGAGPTVKFDVPHPPLHPRCRCCLLPVV